MIITIKYFLISIIFEVRIEAQRPSVHHVEDNEVQ